MENRIVCFALHNGQCAMLISEWNEIKYFDLKYKYAKKEKNSIQFSLPDMCTKRKTSG